MGRASPVLIALLMVGSIGLAPQSVAADDEWPEDCDDAPVVDENGEYNLGIDTPKDTDTLKVRLTRGDYLHLSTMIPSEASSLSLNILPRRTYTIRDGNNVRVSDEPITISFQENKKSSFKLWAEESGTNAYCLEFSDFEPDEVPYDFQLNLSANSPEPPKVGTEEINALESELEQKNQRISKLESLLEQKNQTIAQLRQQSGDVTINVEVTPAGDQQNFITGSEARITANSENAEWNQFSIEYKGDTYSVDSSGTATVPLSGTGEQQMTFRYGDTTQTVSFNVQSQSEGQGDTSGENDVTTDTDGDGVPDSEDYAPRDPDVQDENDIQQNQGGDGDSNALGPGFGVFAAVITILGGAFLLSRYR